MSALNLPFKADYAKSGRSKCHTTSTAIAAGTLRLATMIKSRQFDGMQPNWNDAQAFLTLAKTRRKRPQTTDEIEGFDDLRPADQERVEGWIAAYTKAAAAPALSAADVAHKQAVRAQSELVWKIRDITAGQQQPASGNKAKALPVATLKAILTHHHIPVGGSGVDLVKLLAELIVFGVPPMGDKAKGCCASQPMKFCPQQGCYVCQAPQAWGECTYIQEVADTTCQPIDLQTCLAKTNKVTEAWLEAVQQACGSTDFAPQTRLFVTKTANVRKVNPAVSSSRRRSTAQQTPKAAVPKGTPKPDVSRACMDPACGLDPSRFHVLDEGYDGINNNKGTTSTSSSSRRQPDPAEAFPTDLYDTTLCKTDLASGTNSQYKLQILVPDRSSLSTCYLWRVWGRVGGKGGGGTKLDTFGTVDKAKAEFAKLFQKQTGNEWKDRKSFVKHPGKFFQLDVSYVLDNADDDNDNNNGTTAQAVVANDPHSKLDPRIQEVIAAMFDKGIAMTQLKDMKIDLAKMPLGKMTETQLKDAYSVLTEIEQILTDNTSTTSMTDSMKTGRLQQLSNQFYSKCPSTDPALIDNLKILKNKVEMVDELLSLQASDSVMNDDDSKPSAKNSVAPVDEAYAKLKTEFIPLDPMGPQYAMLKQYVENTRNASLSTGVQTWSGGNDWGSRGLRLLDAFEIHREGEATRFQPSKSLGNRRLLWHGSRISNYSGILSQGLRIAPPEAPVSGYRFGKGVYFADMLGKSANYCRTTGSSEMFIMACDVSLGKTFETSRDMYMEKPQPGTQSTHALSEIIPDPSMSLEVADKDNTPLPSASSPCGADKVMVPLGTPISAGHASMPSCDVSEFIVYDQAQVQIRYLLRLTTNPSSKAVDGTVGGGAQSMPSQSGTTRPRIHISLATRRSLPSSTANATAALANSSSGSDSDDDSDSSSRPSKKLKKSVSCFVRLDKEDRSRPSQSGLKVLNSRTFIEGLRLTVVRGDITESKTAAIVVPSDSQLSLSGMVGEKVKQAAGAAFVAEVQAYLSTPTPPQAAAAGQQAQQPPSGLPSNFTRIDTTTSGKTIRELATDANVPYLTPFYKVIKKENVSATKDVICLQANGTFHRGQAARTFIGMGNGKKETISPAQISAGVEVFVQSTSHNRKMPNNSAVILETSASSIAPPPPPAPTVTRKQLGTSEACAIKGHGLSAGHVIFVVSPIFGQHPPASAESLLKLAVKNSLLECSELGLATVTLPSIGSGRAGYDKCQAAAWIIEAIAVYLEEAGVSGSSPKNQSIEEVCFCLYDDESLEAYQEGILAYDKNSS